MKFMRLFLSAFVALGLTTAAMTADHGEAPLAQANPAADINDLYAFVNGKNLVMAMTVNPFLTPGTAPFDPFVTYSFFIDSDGDAKQDYRLSVNVIKGKIVLRGNLRRHVKKKFAGVRDDPFFFDLDLLSGGPLGEDTFAGANVAAIVVEVPLSKITPDGPNIGVFAVTQKFRVGVVDRMGRAAINTLFIPTGSKDDFNRTRPKDDVAKWSQFIPSGVEFLVPDILTIDVSQPSGYANGRRLQDDVIDISLSLLGGGTDNVDANDVPFLNKFPYLAPPHQLAKAVVENAEEQLQALPTNFALEQAYPNPFNPTTNIQYALPQDGVVTLRVFDLLGREIRTLVNGVQSAGTHTIQWNARDNNGLAVASGIYIYRIEITNSRGQRAFSSVRRMSLLK